MKTENLERIETLYRQLFINFKEKLLIKATVKDSELFDAFRTDLYKELNTSLVFDPLVV